jgi:hypothetical protein
MSERVLGGVMVMGATAEPQVSDCALAPTGDRLDVVELDAESLFAPSPGPVHERASAAIAPGDFAFHCRRDISIACASTLRARAGTVCESLLPEARHQLAQGTLEHGLDVSGRHRVAEQRLCLAQQIVRDLSRGELQREPAGGERGDPRALGDRQGNCRYDYGRVLGDRGGNWF